MDGRISPVVPPFLPDIAKTVDAVGLGARG
jgi:hypothetical protein